jgi:hypothetical protein
MTPAADDDLPEALPKTQTATMTILWAALTGACLMMGAVAVLIGADVPAAAPEVRAVMLPVFAVIALINFSISLFGGSLLARVAPRFLTLMLVRWALAESVAVLGVTLAMLGIDLSIALTFCGLGALGVLLQPASAATYERFRRDVLAARRR